MPQLKYWDGTQYVPILGGIDQATADDRYVKQAGDTMTGGLVIAKKNQSLRIEGDPDYPELFFKKVGGTADNKEWIIYAAGNAAETGADASALAFAAKTDAGTNMGVFRFYRDGRLLLGADATAPLQAVTKQYVDGPAAQAIVFASGWGNYGGNYETAWIKRQPGFVQLTGLIKRTGTALSTSVGSTSLLMTIPADCRPYKDHMFASFVGNHSTNSQGVLLPMNLEGPSGELWACFTAAGTLPTGGYISVDISWPLL